jgi:hypothetical protein
VRYGNNESVTFPKLLLRWLPTFLSFPLGGLLAQLALGPINNFWSAAISGAMVGALLGLSQWWALRPIGVTFDWAWATAVSLMIASPIAGLVTQFETSVAALTTWGLVAGALVGLGQFLTQRRGLVKSVTWAVCVSVTWALAWFISASVIVDAESSYAIFGSTGAIAATTLLLFAIKPLLLKKN